MCSLFGGRVRAVLSAFVFVLAPFATSAPADARICGVMPKSFSCMAGDAQKQAAADSTAPQKMIKVASVRPADKISEIDKRVASKSVSKSKAKRASRKSHKGRKASKSSRKSSRTASRRSGKRSSRKASEKGGAAEGWRTRNTGGQYMVARSGIRTSCFPQKLRSLLQKVSRHYGKKLIITSGYRSRAHNRRIGGAKESQHIQCNAADFYIPGVNKMALGRFLKSLPGRGGVGTYCGNRTVHLDVGQRRSWHWGCGKTRYASKRRAKRRYVSRKRSSRRHYANARFRGSKS